jgi:hypothetical protein
VRTSVGQERPKTGKSKDAERFTCSAHAGESVCDNCPLSKYAPPDLPRVRNPPTGPDIPDACKQRTISIPMNGQPGAAATHPSGKA